MKVQTAYMSLVVAMMKSWSSRDPGANGDTFDKGKLIKGIWGHVLSEANQFS